MSDADVIFDLALKSKNRFSLEINDHGNQVSTSENTVGNMGWKEAPTKLRNGSPYYIPFFSDRNEPITNNGFMINYRENTELWDLTDRCIESISAYIKNIFNIKNLENMASIIRFGGVGAGMPPHQDGPVLNGKEWVDIDFSCFVFLNDDFDGGSIRFEELGISYQPVKGSAVLLSNTSTKKMVHEVEKITRGQRLSLNTFFRKI